MTLPIEPVLPAIREALGARTEAVLVAPPGAGKTTRVPLALLAEPWLAGQRLLMLEPRRLAARAAARYMAATLGEAVGETVGYRVRLESRVSRQTRIEVITEGVLTRLLQADPALEGVGAILFDEFHERSLQADLGLALTLQSQALLRPDLRLLVMSATLDAEPIAALLNRAPIIRSEGRSYPVQTRYLGGPKATERTEATVARTVIQALNETEGDILVFLPGAGEIHRVVERLPERPGLHIAPLYGNLSPVAQDEAILPAPAGERKVVLATAIAETSLTVEGVRVVIDSGLARVPRFSPRTGMTRLETVPVSRASADQRRGRAGRLAPGVCYRLWTEQADQGLVASANPEILDADLAPLALELAAWGVTNPADLRWLDPPPAGALAQARDLLTQLGALDPTGTTITPHGRRMAEAGIHPRLAHMVLKAIELGQGALACDLAAILSERDILRGDNDVDLRLRLAAFKHGGQVALAAQQLRRTFHIGAEEQDEGATGLILAYAYPDRIAQRKGPGRFLLRNGRGARLAEDQPLSAEPYLVAADLDDQGADSRIYLAAPIAQKELEEAHADQFSTETVTAWDRAAQAVRSRTRTRLGALILSERPTPSPDPDATLQALLDGIRQEGLTMLPWTRAARQFQERLAFMHAYDPANWPAATDEALLDQIAPHLYGLKSRDDLQRLPLTDLLEQSLSHQQRRELDAEAPTHITVPSGSKIPVDYSDPQAPVLAVRLQELFGLQQTPRVARGRVPLTMHLLSPAHRPVQVTRDLASFWRTAYFEVRKDLRGRYPKHYWPEDPLQAIPTNRTRPKE